MKLNEMMKKATVILASNLLMAAAVRLLVLPAQLLSGGATGAARVISDVFHLSFSTSTTLLYLIAFVAGAWIMGKSFALSTAASVVLYPLFVKLLQPFSNMVPSLPALPAGILAGIAMGIALKMIMHAGASTGGMDIPAIILDKKLHIPASRTLFVCDVMLALYQVSGCSFNQCVGGLIMIGLTSATLAFRPEKLSIVKNLKKAF